MPSYDDEYRVSYHRAEDILAHPRFPEARRIYLRGILDLYGDDPFLNKLLLEGARQVVFGAILCLLAAQDPHDRSSWPTLANLKKRVRPFGQSSDRKIEHLVSRLISVGFLARQPVAGDGRLRVLTPSEAMLDHDGDWLRVHYRPLALLYPGNDYDLPLARDRVFQLMQRRISFSFIPRSATVLLSNPEIMLFTNYSLRE